MSGWHGVIERYRKWIELPGETQAVTLLEGNTPLIPLPALADEIGAARLLIKFEGLNPTASFKDRGMTVAISEAVSRGARSVICASTGNTAASAAAYAARAGLQCLVLLPSGAVAAGKLAGAQAHGAHVVQLEGSFDQALELARQLSERRPVTLVNSLNPFRLEGQKTAAFEICDALDAAPAWLALPVGNAGNITSYWMGFRQYLNDSLPRLLGVQAAGAAPLVEGHPVDDPQTVASAIRIGRPARGEQALEAVEQSGGQLVAVRDAAILESQRDLAREGIWVEPASAAGLAGLRQAVQHGLQLDGQTVVCVCTGHGLKDPETVPTAAAVHAVPATLDAVESLLEPQ